MAEADPDAAECKDLTQRLESLVIHWTRQIREVANELEASAAGNDEGPLAEIAHWRGRAEDLSGIRAQLGDARVRGVVEFLTRAKSVYLGKFLELRDVVDEQAGAAQSNLKFLQTLTAPCEALAKAKARDVPALLPEILHRVRLIWNTSEHYNIPELSLIHI